MMKSNPNTSQIESLTVARGFFAWWVVGFHFKEWITVDGVSSQLFFQFLKSGYLGVDFFFVLSGFVIFRRYGSEFATLRGAEIRKFLLLRLARIYPLHFVILVFMLVDPIALLLFSKQGSVSGQYPVGYFFQSIFLVQNWGWADPLSWNVPAWSISAELLAYLVFPVFAALIGLDKTKSGVATLSIFGCLILGCATFFSLNGYGSIGESVVKTGAIRCLFEFCLGCCVANIIHKHQQRVFGNGNLIGWLSLLCAIFIIATALFTGLKNYSYIPLTVSAGILGIVMVFHNNNRIPKWLLVIGNTSYSTYLCHWIIKSWFIYLNIPKLLITSALIPIYCGVVMLASILLYRFVEIPAQKYLQKIIGKGDNFRGVAA